MARNKSAKATASTNLNAALKYAEAGYPVLPVWPLRGTDCACSRGAKCKTPGKHPIESGWQKKATTDVQTIRKWFARRPDAHVGVMPPKGCVILDIDPRNNGDEDPLPTLMAGRKLPRTPEQNSGGGKGGRHYVFRGEVHGTLGDGIDIKRAGGGFVVAWPSGHKSGGKYTWRKDHAPWDVAPAPLPERLRGGAVPTGNEERSNDEKFEDLPPNTPIEQVSEALTYIAAEDYEKHWIAYGQALKHAYGDDGYDLWVEWSQTSAKWQDGDEEKWKTFDKNRDRPLKTIASILSEAKKNGWVPESEKPKDSLEAVLEQGRIGNALHEDQPEEDWVIENAASRGTVTLLVGPGGVSKTMLALEASVHIAAGIPFGPFSPGQQPRRVVYMTYEDSRVQLLRRVRNMAMHPATPFNAQQERLIEGNLRIVAPPPEDATSWRLLLPSSDRNGVPETTPRVEWLAELGEQGFDLLILDSLALTHLCSENDTIAMASLMAALSGLARQANIAILALHHVPKMAQGVPFAEISQTSARGATSIVDYARSVFVMTRMHAEDASAYGLKDREHANKTLVGLKHVKMNHGRYLDSVWFERDGETGVLVPRADLAPLSSAERQERREEEKAANHAASYDRKKEAVLRALAEADGQVVPSRRKLWDALRTSNGTKTYGAIVDALVDGKLVEEDEGGVGLPCALRLTADGSAWLAERDPTTMIPARKSKRGRGR